MNFTCHRCKVYQKIFFIAWKVLIFLLKCQTHDLENTSAANEKKEVTVPYITAICNNFIVFPIFSAFYTQQKKEEKPRQSSDIK